jgi:sugar/nucleoside kinase (ribokinase family)
VPGFPLHEVHDPTGAGDCFAGGFMGYLASCGEASDAALRRAMVYGSVMGSFCVEQFGTERLQTLTRAEIDERYRHFRDLMHFD